MAAATAGVDQSSSLLGRRALEPAQEKAQPAQAGRILDAVGPNESQLRLGAIGPAGPDPRAVAKAASPRLQ